MDRDAGGTCYVLSGGMREKPMTAVYFHTDDNSWYFADLDTDTIFSERYRISLRMRMERS